MVATAIEDIASHAAGRVTFIRSPLFYSCCRAADRERGAHAPPATRVNYSSRATTVQGKCCFTHVRLSTGAQRGGMLQRASHGRRQAELRRSEIERSHWLQGQYEKMLDAVRSSNNLRTRGSGCAVSTRSGHYATGRYREIQPEAARYLTRGEKTRHRRAILTTTVKLRAGTAAALPQTETEKGTAAKDGAFPIRAENPTGVASTWNSPTKIPLVRRGSSCVEGSSSRSSRPTTSIRRAIRRHFLDREQYAAFAMTRVPKPRRVHLTKRSMQPYP